MPKISSPYFPNFENSIQQSFWLCNSSFQPYFTKFGLAQSSFGLIYTSFANFQKTQLNSFPHGFFSQHFQTLLKTYSHSLLKNLQPLPPPLDYCRKTSVRRQTLVRRRTVDFCFKNEKNYQIYFLNFDKLKTLVRRPTLIHAFPLAIVLSLLIIFIFTLIYKYWQHSTQIKTPHCVTTQGFAILYTF